MRAIQDTRLAPTIKKKVKKWRWEERNPHPEQALEWLSDDSYQEPYPNFCALWCLEQLDHPDPKASQKKLIKILSELPERTSANEVLSVDVINSLIPLKKL